MTGEVRARLVTRDEPGGPGILLELREGERYVGVVLSRSSAAAMIRVTSGVLAELDHYLKEGFDPRGGREDPEPDAAIQPRGPRPSCPPRQDRPAVARRKRRRK